MNLSRASRTSPFWVKRRVWCYGGRTDNLSSGADAPNAETRTSSCPRYSESNGLSNHEDNSPQVEYYFQLTRIQMALTLLPAVPVCDPRVTPSACAMNASGQGREHYRTSSLSHPATIRCIYAPMHPATMQLTISCRSASLALSVSLCLSLSCRQCTCSSQWRLRSPRRPLHGAPWARPWCWCCSWRPWRRRKPRRRPCRSRTSAATPWRSTAYLWAWTSTWCWSSTCRRKWSFGFWARTATGIRRSFWSPRTWRRWWWCTTACTSRWRWRPWTSFSGWWTPCSASFVWTWRWPCSSIACVRVELVTSTREWCWNSQTACMCMCMCMCRSRRRIAVLRVCRCRLVVTAFPSFCPVQSSSSKSVSTRSSWRGHTHLLTR